MSKKGQLAGMSGQILALVFAAVVLVFGLIMTAEIIDTDAVGGANSNNFSNAYIAGNSTVTGLATFADFWEIIVLAIVITVVIGLLLLTFSRRGAR